jgi:hypothetical protein
MRNPKRKKAAAEPQLSCKIEYFNVADHVGFPAASAYFTDDEVFAMT